MRLEDKYFEEAFREANIQQKIEELRKEGYRVTKDEFFDLIATKEGSKKAYEFKFRNINNRKNDMKKLLQRAKQIDAQLNIVYMLRPTRDSIEFDGLGELIQRYLYDNFPDVLDELSTHTHIEEVYIESITDICLKKAVIQVTGEASISVSLQYGSDREQEEEDENIAFTFPMNYIAMVGWNYEVIDMEYEIDVDAFYE